MNQAREALMDAVPEALAFYAFGSIVRGDEHPGSDLDLAVLLPPGGILANKLGVIAQLAERLDCDIDLVDLRRANLDLIHSVLKEGRILMARDPDAVLDWEVAQMSAYAEFNPRRADIVARYMKEPLTSS